ncbi:DUF3558 domain-containing protein [Actinoalloteichus sp. AHMU CJ021]|uniref:DUF3558 family protein n=1 Tax=Actinoalloteichus caeruleus DSM 43889 TaxID=1120930 RepID=A0ABT1JNW8_ACTCY|nr:DUF3558 family protein [Actinoalloteichus caeruleus]AUS79614.1 DUF3558 domain-containing protein [Actinoalloteichus sp. AHMU CJ021]MCP2333854.1 Protein of unknown function (DUF3558) [Actinoalloteichus caeruleus DSM 43889]
MTRRTPPHRTTALAAITLLTVLTGCTTETTGQAHTPTTPNTTTPDTTTNPDNTTFAEDIADVLPCEVLDDNQITDLGFDPTTAEFDDVGVAYMCLYRPAPLESPLMSINIDRDWALDELNLTNYNSTEHQVGPLRALLVTDDRDPSMCQISMKLSESAHATVAVDFAESQEAACEAAERVAAVVEPELPREQS